MSDFSNLTVGVLALQGAFEEHQYCLEQLGCKTIQVKTPDQLEGLDGIVFPGGESTAMGLIGKKTGIWDALKEFTQTKPTWGTCAGMILLADKCVGTSAVIQEGQSLIGGMDVLACRNYFGSQVSSFEMPIPPPPGHEDGGDFPGVFIRAPAILAAADGVEVLGRVVATPCRQAGAVLKSLDEKIANGENVIMMKVVSDPWISGVKDGVPKSNEICEEKKSESLTAQESIVLPGAADGSEAREVICSVRKDNLLCTAFHPEITQDYRWHSYFLGMVKDAATSS
uniref:glutaminase n=1 Tax=Leptocylindrus danicus TaxID=163516 RepID=A0A7S2KRD6_9STRA|mmetsp:Transcript_25718/g.38478  ORF Transcript_25718/g.38478 Transcript_25718/m.38478 type:complete len:283 (+) Transcript_25718:71-919(+)